MPPLYPQHRHMPDYSRSSSYHLLPSGPEGLKERDEAPVDELIPLADEIRDLNTKYAVKSLRNENMEKHVSSLSPNQLDTPLARIGFKSRVEYSIKEFFRDTSPDGIISKEALQDSFMAIRHRTFDVKGFAGNSDPVMSLSNHADTEQSVREARFMEHLSDYADDLIKLADANGDGKLTIDELVHFMWNRDKQLREMFLEIDTNDNGFIEPEELVAALHKSGLHLTSNDVILLWERMADTNLYGVNHGRRLSYDQFRHFLILIPFKEANFQSIFQLFDKHNISIQDMDLLPLPSRPLERLTRTEKQKYFLAGGVAGIFGRTLTAPMDRMRIYLQNETQEVFSKSELKRHAGQGQSRSIASTTKHFLHGLQLLYRTRGIKEFWRGNAVECFRVFPATAIQFYTVEWAKAMFRAFEGTKTRSEISHTGRFVAGAVGGMASVLALFPVSTIKVRMMSAVEGEAVAQEYHHSTPLDKKVVGQRNFSTFRVNNMMDPMYGKSFSTSTNSQEWRPWPAARALYRQEGIRGFYRGLGISLLGVAPFAGFNYAIYEAFKQTALRNPDLVRVDQLRVFYYGLTSASIATAICYPFQIIKTRMQAQGTPGHPDRYVNTLDCIRKLVKNEGSHGFFKGMGATFGRTIPAAVITRLAFEQNKMWLGIP